VLVPLYGDIFLTFAQNRDDRLFIVHLRSFINPLFFFWFPVLIWFLSYEFVVRKLTPLLFLFHYNPFRFIWFNYKKKKKKKKKKGGERENARIERCVSYCGQIDETVRFGLAMPTFRRYLLFQTETSYIRVSKRVRVFRRLHFIPATEAAQNVGVSLRKNGSYQRLEFASQNLRSWFSYLVTIWFPNSHYQFEISIELYFSCWSNLLLLFFPDFGFLIRGSERCWLIRNCLNLNSSHSSLEPYV